jgi:hypothetical protein
MEMIPFGPGIFQNQVGILGDCHKLGECRPPEERVIRRLKVGYLKLQVFSPKIFPSPKGHGKSNLVDRGSCCARDYAMKQSPTVPD